jgi:hypothetical protein
MSQQDPPIIVTGGDSFRSTSQQPPEQPPDPPIIVTGGSVTVEFDVSILQPDGKNKFVAPDKQITRIEVKGDGIDFGQDTSDGKVTVKVFFADAS